MLNAFRTGYLNLWECPDILKEIKGANLFLEVMKASTAKDGKKELSETEISVKQPSKIE